MLAVSAGSCSLILDMWMQGIRLYLQTHMFSGVEHCITRASLSSALCSFEVEGFDTKCECLQRNTECDANCACEGDQCLNRSVGQRRPLRLGEDVAEIDSWGFDCYTRRNFFDGGCQMCATRAVQSRPPCTWCCCCTLLSTQCDACHPIKRCVDAF